MRGSWKRKLARATVSDKGFSYGIWLAIEGLAAAIGGAVAPVRTFQLGPIGRESIDNLLSIE